VTRSRTLFDRHGAFAEYVDGELVWAREDVALHETDSGPQIVRDLEPYRSMIDGRMIDGRKRHRDHLRAHGCIEIGNDTGHMARKTLPPKISAKESLHRVMADVGDRDLSRIIQKTIRDMR
jgi:hypothetical protein